MTKTDLDTDSIPKEIHLRRRVVRFGEDLGLTTGVTPQLSTHGVPCCGRTAKQTGGMPDTRGALRGLPFADRVLTVEV